MKTQLLVSALSGVALLALSACGGSEPKSATETDTASAESGSSPWDVYASPWDHESDAVTRTDSGLEYIVLKNGSDCDEGPTESDRAIVHYEGRLIDGTVFDASFKRGEPTNFPANRVISGWTEALGLMCPGDDWLVYLPSDIAYGQSPRPGGPIKPGDDLIFRMVLLADISASDWTGESFK